MALEKLLSQRKASILERWFNLIAETHSPEVSSFLKHKDRFNNPVGYTISQEMNALYEELLQSEVNLEKVSASLDNVIKIRAVQDLSPARAIDFIFLLKEAIREELGSEIEQKQVFGEWLNFESKIDKMASLAFDTYVRCREKIYELRVNEVKADRERAFKLIEMMGRVNTKHGEVME